MFDNMDNKRFYLPRTFFHNIRYILCGLNDNIACIHGHMSHHISHILHFHIFSILLVILQSLMNGQITLRYLIGLNGVILKNISKSELDLDTLKEKLLKFRDERNWKQFHDPKNLAEAISVEAGELLENFLWKSVEQSKKLNVKNIKNIISEVSDIFIFCIYLSHELDFDLIEEAYNKISENIDKYPKEKSYGVSTKYTEF